jgi:flagellar hook-basal body complex protein FliE
MAVLPISSPTIDQFFKSSALGQKKEVAPPFDQILKDAVESVKQAENDVAKESIRVAAGESDDLHSLMISSEKAELALAALVQVRNKALDAYNEIMRMSV